MTTLDEQISSWSQAEQAGDAGRLDTLLHPGPDGQADHGTRRASPATSVRRSQRWFAETAAGTGRQPRPCWN
jgi:hypothetical protein